ncbi:MAG: hypothetical protein AAGI07_01655 [Bacteroidota bacterium]
MYQLRTLNYSFISILILLFACSDNNDIPTENYLRVRVNGVEWEAFQINIQKQEVNSGEVEISIVATSDLNEAVIIGIQAFENELQGRTQEVTSLANGDFFGYRSPGAGTGLETHSSFGCSSIDGTIFIEEYNAEEGYISGSFGGTVCEQGGQNPITLTEGTFTRLAFD